MDIWRFPREIPTVKPETIFHVGNFPVANSTLMSFFMVIVVAAVCLYLNRKASLKPRLFQQIVEMIYEAMVGMVHRITADQKRTETIFPIVGALFVFVGLSNVLGLLPGLQSFTYDRQPLLRVPTSDFNTTFTLAIGMIILIQIISVREWGILGFIGRYIKIKELTHGLRHGFGGMAMALIEFFIGLLEIIAEFAKIISLSLRLFGNIYAHEVLTVIIMSGFAFGVPAIWLGMGVLVAVVQTIVFGSLLTAYYMMAAKPVSKT